MNTLDKFKFGFIDIMDNISVWEYVIKNREHPDEFWDSLNFCCGSPQSQRSGLGKDSKS